MSIINDFIAGAETITGIGNGGVADWFKSLGADIASGLETGFVAITRDIWNVVSGPVLVIAGIVILLWVMFLFFLPDVIELGKFAATTVAGMIP